MMKFFEKKYSWADCSKGLCFPHREILLRWAVLVKRYKKAPVIRPGLMLNELLAIYSCSQSNPAQDIPLSADCS